MSNDLLDNTVIENRASSIESKNGVFSSFFDIRKLFKLYSSYGLNFAHNIYLVPRMKFLRINGYKKNTLSENSVFHNKDKGKGKADVLYTKGKGKAAVLQTIGKGKATILHTKGKEKADISNKNAGTTEQDLNRTSGLRTLIDKLQAELKDLNKREK